MNTLSGRSIRSFLTLIALTGAFGTGSMVAHKQNESSQPTGQRPGCPVCLEDYSDSIIPVQLDCGRTTQHNACLDCLQDLSAAGHTACPMCRAPGFKIIDPRVASQDSTQIHHLNRSLTAKEQQTLRSVLQSRPLSSRTHPDTLYRWCEGCKKEVPSENVVIEFIDNQNMCLEHAVRYAENHKGTLSAINPLRGDYTRVVLTYKDRVPSTNEAALIEKLRSLKNVKLITPGEAYVPSQEGSPNLSEEFTQNLSEKELQLNYGTSYTMPEASMPLPPMPITEEDIRLNKHLPEQYDKKEWQVIIDKDGKLLRARRTHTLEEWPPTEAVKEESAKPVEGPLKYFKGFKGDLITGALCGLLAGKELSPNQDGIGLRRALYPVALAGSYSLMKKTNPTITAERGLTWAAGTGLGMLAHYLLFR